MAHPDSIDIDDREKTIRIALNPTLYPQSAVMRASYRFTEDFGVIVDGEALSKIFVTIKIKQEDKKTATKEDMEHVADAFFSELIHANVEEMQARRYADTRNALIGAALRSIMPQITPEALQKLSLQKDAGVNTSTNANSDANTNAGTKSSVETSKQSAKDIIYNYMPKLNCGRCGGNCEKTAKKIASGECTVDICHNLKKPEFTVVRDELNNALRNLQITAGTCSDDTYDR